MTVVSSDETASVTGEVTGPATGTCSRAPGSHVAGGSVGSEVGDVVGSVGAVVGGVDGSPDVGDVDGPAVGVGPGGVAVGAVPVGCIGYAGVGTGLSAGGMVIDAAGLAGTDGCTTGGPAAMAPDGTMPSPAAYPRITTTAPASAPATAASRRSTVPGPEKPTLSSLRRVRNARTGVPKPLHVQPWRAKVAKPVTSGLIRTVPSSHNLTAGFDRMRPA